MTDSLHVYLEQLQDEQPAVRAAAVHHIRQLRDPAAIDALVWLMGDDSLWVRCTAAEALGEFRTQAVVTPLMQFLHLGAALEKQKVGLPAEIPIDYHRFHREQDPHFQQWRTEQGIKSPHQGFSLAVSARIGLQMTGIEATDALIKSLNDKNPYVQYIAVNLLNNMAIRKRPSNALLLAISEDDPMIRMNAARALGKLGNLRAVRSLIPLVRDENVQVRLAAAESLGAIQDTRAVPALLEAIHDPEVQHIAWLALHNMNVDPDEAQT